MDYERWLLEDALDFEFDGRGYLFEPEYTQEELREMEAAEAVPRITGNWWCACGKCRQMPTEVESRCCTEWDLVVTTGMANLNVSVDETVSPCISINEVRHLLNKTVVETFFWVPKINWKKRPTPEGPNGRMANCQIGNTDLWLIESFWSGPSKVNHWDEEITLDYPVAWCGLLGMRSHPPLDSMLGLNPVR
ncbi:unnamed protein product [Boreogadus saida]